MGRRDEFDLIARLFAPLAAAEPGAYGLTDDAAVVDLPPGESLVVTADAIVAGVHFLADDPPDLIARKLVRVNLSDLAAMGARPRALIATTAFPRDVSDAWIEAFAAGLATDCRLFSVPLVGGDTVATPGPATFSLTALGLVPAGRALRRAGARPGDAVYVSGTLGDAALGLLALTGRLTGAGADALDALIRRYRLPEPRTGLGPRLLGVASAAIDVSDGLLQDLGHIARQSGAGLVIEADRLPLSAAARLLADTAPGVAVLESVLAGGDDYELAFTAADTDDDRVQAAATAAGVAVTRIGRVVAGHGVTVLDAGGRPLSPARTGWRHFGQDTSPETGQGTDTTGEDR